MNKFFRLSAAVLFLGSSLALVGADLTFRDAEIVIAKKATFAAETGARDLQYHLRFRQDLQSNQAAVRLSP